MRPDAVTPELRDEVMALDGQRCVARRLDPDVDVCRNRWGAPIISSGKMPKSALTLDHVKDKPHVGAPVVKRTDGGKIRAPSDARHLVTICAGHHLLSGWATGHRQQLRSYLANRHGVAE